MVAYSFKARFVEPIRVGAKTQTIRADRKRHARVGEPVQLYCGMRTARCFKIADDPVVTEVLTVELLLGKNRVYLSFGREPDGSKAGFYTIASADGLDHFARLDGFEDWAAMKGFWADQHPEAITPDSTFDGVLINWGRPHFALRPSA